MSIIVIQLMTFIDSHQIHKNGVFFRALPFRIHFIELDRKGMVHTYSPVICSIYIC